jgi:hypothetical protein
MTQWRGHAISGLTGGANVATAGLGGIGSAVNANTTASAGVSSSYNASANFWSTVSSMGIKMIGVDQGISRVRGNSSNTAFGSNAGGGSLMGNTSQWMDSNDGGGIWAAGTDNGGYN